MGDEYDRMEALADQMEGELFELPTNVPVPSESTVRRSDPMRPQAVRGRYTAPHPVTGKSQSWQRVSNLVKKAEDTYHLELWKQRNVAKGLAMRPDLVEVVQRLDVKADKTQMDKICEKAQDLAGAYLMSDEGTRLHESTELVDFADGNLNVAPERHRRKVQLYLDALRVNGLAVAPGMIERFVVSAEYEVAGTFDRIFQLGDGSYVLGDLKTGDSIDLSAHAISGQMDCYRRAINDHGVWDGVRYDSRIKVRDDFALVVHLPSTRDEVSVQRIDLARGAALNEVTRSVRESQRVKARHVMQVFDARAYRTSGATAEQEWLEEANAAHTVPELMSVADRARAFGQYTERLAGQFRLLAGEIAAATAAIGGMGS